MAHPDDTTGNGSRRVQRMKRRKHWQLRLLLGLLGTLIVTGTAFAFTGALRSGGAGRRAATHSPTTTTRATPASDVAACRSPLDATAPLRLWIGGDSLAGSLGPSLGDLTGKTGVVQPVFNSRVGSGLASPDYYDWSKHAGEDIFKYNPEVVVFIIGANDAKVLPKTAGSDPQWHAQYGKLVEQMMTLLVGGHRDVYWVGAPVMKDDDYSTKVKTVNDVYKEVASRHPQITYIDSYTAFASPDGRYAPSLPATDGKPVRVRADDGVHFTPDGGDLLAKAVFDKLDPACRLMKQAVLGAPKTTIEVQGSSQIPGTRRGATTATTSAGPPPTAPAPATTTRPEATAPPQTTSPPTTAPPTTSALCPPACT
jgi:hypothetical protein